MATRQRGHTCPSQRQLVDVVVACAVAAAKRFYQVVMIAQNVAQGQVVVGHRRPIGPTGASAWDFRA